MANTSILIVEDELVVALDIQGCLERAGYTVIGQAIRGDEAIEKAASLRPDLVLMDIGLKGPLDGIEAARKIREAYDLPIIFLTAFTDPPTLERARLAEPAAYVIKPFDERELISNIEIAYYKHGLERKLRENEARYRVLIETSPDAIGLYDLQQHRLTAVNQQFLRLHGFASLEEVQEHGWDINFVDEADRDLMRTRINEILTNHTNRAIELTARRKDGSTFPAEFNAAAMYDAQGQPIALVFISRDITERKQAEQALRESQTRLQSFVSNAPVILFGLELDGTFTFSEGRGLQSLGLQPGEVVGRSVFEVYANFPQIIESVRRVLAGEIQAAVHDVGSAVFDTYYTLVKDDQGRPTGVIGVATDITARRALEIAERDQRRLAEALRDTALALNSSLKLDDVLDRIMDDIGKIVPYDALAILLFDEQRTQLVRYRNMVPCDMPPGDIAALETSLADKPLLQELIETGQPWLLADTLHDPRWEEIDGAQWVRAQISAPLSIRGRTAGAIVLSSAVPDFFTREHADRLTAFASQAAVAVENARLYEQAQRLSVTDPLTELQNRRSFFDAARIEFERLRRYGGTLAVLMADIDHFKRLNDTFGHAAGDLALQQIAARIKHTIRSIDIAARYGGEEFVILMPGTDARAAAEVAERIRLAIITTPLADEPQPVHATISLGVAEADRSCASMDDLLQHADEALYAAKSAGRNCVAIYNRPSIDPNPSAA